VFKLLRVYIKKRTHNMGAFFYINNIHTL